MHLTARAFCEYEQGMFLSFVITTKLTLSNHLVCTYLTNHPLMSSRVPFSAISQTSFLARKD